MNPITTADSGPEILSRIIRPTEGGMSADAARCILAFRLDEQDVNRVNELADKAREGTLTVSEQHQLDKYERVTAMIELMQSKARVALRQAESST